MREAQFLKQNAAKWRQYEGELKQQQNPDVLADRFIELTDDFSYSKTFYPNSNTSKYLNGLTSLFHQKIYTNKKEKSSRIWSFWQFELPYLFRLYHRQFLYAFIFFTVFCAMGALSAKYDENFIRLILGDGYVNMTNENIEKGDPFGVYKRNGPLDMFFYIAFNNIRVAFVAYVLGASFGVGTIWLLLSNGLMLGSFEYFFFSKGLGFKSITVVFIHGTLEIWAIVIAGAAGLILGNSILFPGTYARSVSFLRGGRDGLKIVIGLLPLFLTAAFLEGFVTRYDSMPLWSSLSILGGSLLFITWYFIIYPVRLHQTNECCFTTCKNRHRKPKLYPMAEQKVELRKIRDFSENINDTFTFIRQNLKPLLLSFIGIAGIFMLATAIFNGLYQAQMGDMFKQIFTGRTESSNTLAMDMFGPTYFLMLLLGIVNFVAMKVTVIAYMKLYEEKGNVTPSMAEVWGEFSKYFLKVFLFSIPVFVLIILGMFLCIAPGIWLAVVLAPFEIMLMTEDRSFGDAYKRCFTIIKQNFWMSLGIYIVAVMIYYFCSLIVGVVVAIVAGAISWMSTKDLGSTVGIVTSILNIFSFFFSIIYFVSVVLNYYSLTEKYEGTGMMKRLDTIGGASPDIHSSEEEY